MKLLINKQYYTFEKNKAYILFTNRIRFDKQVFNDNKDYLQTISFLFLDWNIFNLSFFNRKKTVKSFLHHYSFNDDEISDIVLDVRNRIIKYYKEENFPQELIQKITLNFNEKTRIDKVDFHTKSILLINILLKNSDLILMITAPLTLYSVKEQLEILYSRIQNSNKIAIIFQEVDNPKITSEIHEVDNDLINQYFSDKNQKYGLKRNFKGLI